MPTHTIWKYTAHFSMPTHVIWKLTFHLHYAYPHNLEIHLFLPAHLRDLASHFFTFLHACPRDLEIHFPFTLSISSMPTHVTWKYTSHFSMPTHSPQWIFLLLSSHSPYLSWFFLYHLLCSRSPLLLIFLIFSSLTRPASSSSGQFSIYFFGAC